MAQAAGLSQLAAQPETRPIRGSTVVGHSRSAMGTSSGGSSPNSALGQVIDPVDTNKSSNQPSQDNPWRSKTVLTFGLFRPFMDFGWLLIPRVDGGGVRGYSSLLILRELMDQIKRLETRDQADPAESSAHPLQHRARARERLQSARTRTRTLQSNRSSTSSVAGHRSRFLPAHYFDYIGGTSTGGYERRFKVTAHVYMLRSPDSSPSCWVVY